MIQTNTTKLLGVIISQFWKHLQLEANIRLCYTIVTAIIITMKWGITMGEVIRKFTQLNGRTATIILEHCWFGKQRFEAQEVNVFEDEDRLGLILKGQAVYVYMYISYPISWILTALAHFICSAIYLRIIKKRNASVPAEEQAATVS